jgi:cob(I)alamin adenosyltransferase
MKIYTKTGDLGETGLFAGPRVAKDDARVESYGTVDELSSAIGVADAYTNDAESKSLLQQIQDDLFTVGAELATPDARKRNVAVLGRETVRLLELAIDRMELHLRPLENFILPGGSPAAAHVHLARSICRRAERRIVSLNRNVELSENVIPYFNRLSDFLFVLARYQNQVAGIDDKVWQPRS